MPIFDGNLHASAQKNDIVDRLPNVKSGFVLNGRSIFSSSTTHTEKKACLSSCQRKNAFDGAAALDLNRWLVDLCGVQLGVHVQ